MNGQQLEIRKGLDTLNALEQGAALTIATDAKRLYVRSRATLVESRTILFRMELKQERGKWQELRKQIIEAGKRIAKLQQGRLV